MNKNSIKKFFLYLFFTFVTSIIVMIPFIILEVYLQFTFTKKSTTPSQEYIDPFVMIDEYEPFFVWNDSKTHYEINPVYHPFFRPQKFNAKKKDDTFRIFCIGGSTVQGRPYSVQTAFPKWIQLGLQQLLQDKKIEMINCGGVSYASYRLLPILKSAVQLKPNLFIIYTGHNEFLEDRTYRTISKLPSFIVSIHNFLMKTNTYALLYYSVKNRKLSRPKYTMSQDVITKLDMERGLALFKRDETLRQNVIDHFRNNIHTMIQLLQARNIPLLLVNPVSNIKDCYPFKSEHDQTLTNRELHQVQRSIEYAESIPWTDKQKKVDAYQKVVEQDPRHASSLFMLGKSYEIVGRYQEAKEWYIKAKDEDICPLRILEPMHSVIIESSQEYNVPLVDARELFTAKSEKKIPGNEWLIDHVHPHIRGHQEIAFAILEQLKQREIVLIKNLDRTIMQSVWNQHTAHLEQTYFEQGRIRLQRLREWSRSRIPKFPNEL